MTSRTRRLLGRVAMTGAVMLVLPLARPMHVAAQPTEDLPALKKSDVVLMLASPDLDQDVLADAIRSRCLSFSPTPADLEDFRRLGAGDAVIGAIRDCVPDTDAASRDAAAAARVSVLGVSVGPDGEEVRLRVTRGGVSAPGVEVILVVRPPAVSEARILARRRSGPDGRVTLRVPADRIAPRYVVRPAAAPAGGPAEVGVTGATMRLPADDSLSLPAASSDGELDAPLADTIPVGSGAPWVEAAIAAAGAALEPDTSRSGEIGAGREGPSPREPSRPDSPSGGDPASEAARADGRNADRPSWLDLIVLGGESTGELALRSGPGLLALEARVSPVPGAVTFWYRFDDGLHLRRGELSRGPTSYRSHFGGASVRYHAGSMETRVEAGRREQPPASRDEVVVSLDQVFFLGARAVPDFRRIQVGLGGTWGRWGTSVEDELFLRAAAGFPVSPILRTEIAVHYGEGFGTVPSTEDWTSRAREVRVEVAPVLRSGGWRLALGAAYGSVEAVPDERRGQAAGDVRFSGSHWNVRGHGTIPLAGTVRLEGIYRWQSPPGFDSYSVFGLGLSAAVPY